VALAVGYGSSGFGYLLLHQWLKAISYCTSGLRLFPIAPVAFWLLTVVAVVLAVCYCSSGLGFQPMAMAAVASVVRYGSRCCGCWLLPQRLWLFAIVEMGSAID
jgi:hypothetical protein